MFYCVVSRHVKDKQESSHVCAEWRVIWKRETTVKACQSEC